MSEFWWTVMCVLTLYWLRRNKPTNESEAEGRGTDAAGKEPAAKE